MKAFYGALVLSQTFVNLAFAVYFALVGTFILSLLFGLMLAGHIGAFITEYNEMKQKGLDWKEGL